MFLHLQSNCQIVSLGLDHGNVKYINCFKKIVEVLKHDFCGSNTRSSGRYQIRLCSVGKYLFTRKLKLND